MGKYLLSGLTTVVVAAGIGLVAGAGPAFADPVPSLYVNKASAACSDGGSGTQAVPYCTIGAAVAVAGPGQTVEVAGGPYSEHVTIAKSGEPGRPITLQGARLSGAGAGLTVDGRHDIVLTNITMVLLQNGPGLDLRNSTRITANGVTSSLNNQVAVPAIVLAAVTDSTLLGVRGYGSSSPAGISLDAATARVTLTASNGNVGGLTGGVGLEVKGSNITVVNGSFTGGTGPGVAFRPGAAGNTIVNSYVQNSQGPGILSDGATGTAITNNDVYYNCGGGIRVSGASSGVSVQNNVVVDNGPSRSGCETAAPDAVEIGLFDAAAGTTTVDYNGVSRPHGTGSLYWWKGPLDRPGFRAAAKQAAHDVDYYTTGDGEDAANSAAPGYPSTDRAGRQREDNPGRPDTGAGPVTYADLGSSELTGPPTAVLTVTANQRTSTITADASGSWRGYRPIAKYTFDFGDGTPPVTQATPVATHHYATPGTYGAAVTVADTHGYSGTVGQGFSLWPTARTIALLAHNNNRYVTAGPDGSYSLNAGPAAIGAGTRIEVIELGGGRVALRSPENGLYLAAATPGSGASLNFTTPMTDDQAQFELTTNADGTVTLRSVTNAAYVSSNNGGRALSADRTAIGDWERFGVVDAADAGITLRAHANNRYVTAEGAGGLPLIANRTSVGSWEQYDLVDAGGGWVALYSRANGNYVTAENGGNSPLVANRAAIGPWEKFKVVKNADGSIALLAAANNRYVTAEAGGDKALIANRTAIGLWESFDRG